MKLNVFDINIKGLVPKNHFFIEKDWWN